MKKVVSYLKVLSIRRIMTLLIEEVSTNLVPAVAVIRGRRALLYVTWCKAYLGCFISYFLNTKYDFSKGR